MNTYELTIVLTGSMPEPKQKAVLDKIKKAVADSGGKVDKEDSWGKKQLAYPIKHEKEGYYFFFELMLPPDHANGIKRLIENDEQVARHLLIRTQDKVQSTQGKKETAPETEKQSVDKEKKVVKSKRKARKK
ncbi:MAG: 30S ribosomal protein S6 [Candidatus Blackburnbacteria bacterium RIFCSPHIGHO2_12_FULL_41_13b]|uniref:Small ribosomal subunit protein bS6 n=1 Tax=Candidatus Blackburnbacteria bacterium RIFCSPHIGHO2_12_FULL_41_13b TaxID=1797517 RepID=A0A1G1V6C1_9BACT|nr:MAG: 30S ribosomal protein S6 [Candidatus Blackburnbacteria bacterium RIFCSPHIGHO2_12_FULL_41_13b]